MPNNAAKLLVALPLPLPLALPPPLPLPGTVVVAPTVPPSLPRPLPLSLALAALALVLEGSKIVLVDKLIVKQRIKDLNMQKNICGHPSLTLMFVMHLGQQSPLLVHFVMMRVFSFD